MSQLKQNEHCPTVLLDDDPAEKDQFGSHDRLAQAILRLILEEKGGRSIGVVGRWGAGKSSVLKIMETSAQQKAHIFLFDAWAHQGDPLRRVFLEKLIDFFQERLPLDSEKWNKKREVLAKRREDLITTEQSVLTSTGLVVSFATAVFLVSVSSFSLERLFGAGLAYRAAIWSLIGIIASIIIALITVIASQNKKHTILGLLQKTNATESSSVKTPEPTTVEFQALFGELLNECINGDNAKPFVIAVDNLDRVSQADAGAIWSTLRAFMELRSFDKHEWSKRAWLVVAFDPSILQSWAGDKDVDSAEVFANVSLSHASSVSESFLEKTFQAVFYVPTPVLFDSHEFLLANLKCAFPDHAIDELQDVVRLLRTPKFSQGPPPTPRGMKWFINQLGSLHRQWSDTVPLVVQALYLLLKTENGINILSVIQNSDDNNVLGAIPPGLIPSDWREWVVGLHFNLPKERAIHTLLTPRIAGALESGDSEAVGSMAREYGFLRVLEDFVEYRISSWHQNQSATIALAARSIALLRKDNSSILKIQRQLCAAAAKVQAWSAFNIRVAEGILELIKCNDEVVFHRHIILTLGTPGAFVRASDKADEWVEGVIVVLEDVKSRHSYLLGEFRLAGDLYIPLIEAFARNGKSRSIPEIWEPMDVQQAFSMFMNTVNNGAFKDSHLDATRYLAGKYGHFEECSKMATCLSDYFENSAVSSASILSGLLLISINNEVAHQRILELIDSGMLSRKFELFMNADLFESAATCAITVLVSKVLNPSISPAVAQFVQQIVSTNSEALAIAIAKSAKSLSLEEEVLIAINRKEKHSFLVLLQKELSGKRVAANAQ